MAPSRAAAAGLAGFLSDTRSQGLREALRRLDLSKLAGRPIQEVFLGLTDAFCPDGGTIDEAIARDAFIETIAEVVESGVVDLDALTLDQMLLLLELFISRTIEGRLHNDVGTKTIVLPESIAAVHSVQQQIHDFVRGAVRDALHELRANMDPIAGEEVDRVVSEIYTRSFEVLRVMAEALI